MKWIILTIIGIIMGYWLGRKRMLAMRKVTDSLNQQQTEKKIQHLAEIMEMVNAEGEITNDWVEKSFNVSDATAERYLNELEQQGKIVQIGRVGHSVKYALNKGI